MIKMSAGIFASMLFVISSSVLANDPISGPKILNDAQMEKIVAGASLTTRGLCGNFSECEITIGDDPRTFNGTGPNDVRDGSEGPIWGNPNDVRAGRVICDAGAVCLVPIWN